MKFREFRNEDADFCYKTRNTVFNSLFNNEIDAGAVKAATSAYHPDDYIKMSKSSVIKIIEEDKKPVGFFLLKRINRETAELLLIYFKSDCLGKGYGKRTMKYIEDWIIKNWSDINSIYLDTIIPKYNGEFYTKMGYAKIMNTTCVFNNLQVPAMRYEKKL